MPNYRADEKNSYVRRDFLNAIGGFLHHQIIWLQSLHTQYQLPGSRLGLEAAIKNMERKGLRDPATKGTYFNILADLFNHVGEAHFRSLWLTVSGCESISELRDESAANLLALATRIWDDYASMNAIVRLEEATEKDRDEHFLVIAPLLRDFLNYVEFDDAMASGDPGRMINMFGRMLYQYAGGHNPKYAMEMLELLQGLKHEWPEDLM